MTGRLLGNLLRSASLAAAFGASGADAADIYCAPHSKAAAVDLSAPVDQAFLDKMKEFGVGTIIRYYDQPDETIPHKTLHWPERELITRNNLALLVVFQHHNDWPKKFKAQTGHEDAKRALELAHENRQPESSAIYFGVDYDVHLSPEDGEADIDKKFEGIDAYFAAIIEEIPSKYKIGVYGSGAVCDRLLKNNRGELCWVSQSYKFSGTPDALKRGTFDLRQLNLKNELGLKLPWEKCGGREVDFSMAKTPGANFGQFRGYSSD